MATFRLNKKNCHRELAKAAMSEEERDDSPSSMYLQISK